MTAGSHFIPSFQSSNQIEKNKRRIPLPAPESPAACENCFSSSLSIQRKRIRKGNHSHRSSSYQTVPSNSIPFPVPPLSHSRREVAFASTYKHFEDQTHKSNSIPSISFSFLPHLPVARDPLFEWICAQCLPWIGDRVAG